jgi:hypothetical protein
MTPDVLSCCSRRAGAVAGTTTVTGALAQPKTAEAPDASHGHDSGEGHGAKLSAAQQDEVITAIEKRQASEFTYPSAQPFFNAIRTSNGAVSSGSYCLCLQSLWAFICDYIPSTLAQTEAPMPEASIFEILPRLKLLEANVAGTPKEFPP